MKNGIFILPNLKLERKFVSRIRVNNSIITKIENRINSFGRGSIFYPDDFLDLGTSDAIRQSLTRLCKDEKIVRVA